MTRSASNTEALTLHVPIRLVKRGGHKEIKLPDDVPEKPQTDNTLVKALARAFRWKRMLESGEFATIAELAERERITPPYVTRILQLTLLAPDIVNAILDGRQGTDITLTRLRDPVPLGWVDQRELFRKRAAPEQKSA